MTTAGLLSTGTSVSLFPLTYLGYSVIQRSNDCELETIYELLMEYYLQFLKNCIRQQNSSTPFKTTMSKSYETVVVAIGNGNLTIRTLNMNSDPKSKKTVEENFLAQDLLYFNCYYLEVVTPVGRDKEICYAYFRRAVDARRCVPEEALVRLDRKMSTWLLSHRSIIRPPLIYCIVPRPGSIRSLVCFVFLADTIQIGLKIVRCLAELRYSNNRDRPVIQQNFADRVHMEKRQIPTESKHHLVCSTSSQLHNPDQLKVSYVDQPKNSLDDNYYIPSTDFRRPCLSARAARSHNDLIMAFDQMNLNNQGHCNTSCEFLANSVYPCPAHTKCSDRHRARLLQIKLGHEALDFYRHRHRISSADRLNSQMKVIRDRSVPDMLRHERPMQDCLESYCPECNLILGGPRTTYSPHRIRRPIRRQQHQKQHSEVQNQCYHSRKDACRDCLSNEYMDSRNTTNKCHCHAHLGGSLELIP